MGVEDLAGVPSSAEGGFFDPFGLSKGKDEETIRWYRSAELKHGRISMLATLGIVVQGYNTKIIPGFPVTETNAIEALKKVYYEAPSALVQVCDISCL
jgi:Chlorophyll A-B binding protein